MFKNSNVPQIILTIGLPLSGKSTWIKSCEELKDFNYVSADLLKESHPEYDPNRAFKLHEWSIEEAEKQLRLIAHSNGHGNIIFDSGSINNSYTKRIIDFFKARGYKVTLVWVKTPINVCLERNKTRIRKVPEEAIIDKAQKEKSQFYRLCKDVDKVYIIPYFTNNNLWIDMDGVLAAYSTLPIINGEVDFVNGRFFKHLKPVKQVIDKFLTLQNSHKLRILSASPNSIAQQEKHKWLDKHFNIPREDRYFANAGRHKAQMLEGLCQRLKIDKRDSTMIDDNHDILEQVKQRNMRPLHISSFLVEEFV